MDETAYLTKVRQVLDELGSNNSSADITGSGDYWKHCRQVGIDAKVCAATIYSGVRHRHEVARTVIKEATSAASEAPVREEWEVVVKRAGVDADSITSSAGRRPDEVTSGNVVFAGFNDDEKAAAFSKKMTKAGYISSFGPRRDYTLHEEAGKHTSRQELGALMQPWSRYYGDPIEFVGSHYRIDLVVPQKSSVQAAKRETESILQSLTRSSPHHGPHRTERRELRRIVRGLDDFLLKDYPATASEDREWSKVTLNSEADATALWKQLHVKYTVDQLGPNIWTTARYDEVLRALDRAGVKGHIHREVEEAAETPAAASSDAAAECASCVPWQKVSRDATAAAANTELAAKYGPIKNAQDVYRVIGDAMNKETNEVFLVIPLDLRGELKAPPYEVARGQLSRVTVDPGDVLRAAIHAGAEAYICAHNHPTGKATPSKADRDLTKSIKDATAVYGKSLTYVDHVVIGQKRAYSIGENKMYKCE